MQLAQLLLETVRTRLANNTGLTTTSGSTTTTTGTISAGSNVLTVASASSFNVGQSIIIAGAGTGGSSLLTWITAIVGTTFTLHIKAITAITDAVISHDDRAIIPTANIQAASSNFPVSFPAIAIAVEGSTGDNFTDSFSGYLWLYVYFESGTGKGQPTTILNMIISRIRDLLHGHENDLSNNVIRVDYVKEHYRSVIVPEVDLGDYIHSQTIRYNFMSHEL